MSNKLKKKITCAFCEKTVPYTSDCRELFGRDVCPECVEKIVRVVNKLSIDSEAAASGVVEESED